MQEATQEMLTINTNKCLNYGVKGVPSMFQQLVDTVPTNVPKAVAYLDEVLTIGSTDKRLLQRLGKFMENLIDNGLKLTWKRVRFLEREPTTWDLWCADERHSSSSSRPSVPPLPFTLGPAVADIPCPIFGAEFIVVFCSTASSPVLIVRLPHSLSGSGYTFLLGFTSALESLTPTRLVHFTTSSPINPIACVPNPVPLLHRVMCFLT
nr:unnamed protein product [Spirometra erinaceieuropaei]